MYDKIKSVHTSYADPLKIEKREKINQSLKRLKKEKGAASQHDAIGRMKNHKLT
jgi:hypothetical protein